MVGFNREEGKGGEIEQMEKEKMEGYFGFFRTVLLSVYFHFGVSFYYRDF